MDESERRREKIASNLIGLEELLNMKKENRVIVELSTIFIQLL